MRAQMVGLIGSPARSPRATAFLSGLSQASSAVTRLNGAGALVTHARGAGFLRRGRALRELRGAGCGVGAPFDARSLCAPRTAVEPIDRCRT
jgi:hypothetical protein